MKTVRVAGLWRLDKVMTMVRGKDGNVHGATVTVAEQGKKKICIQRPYDQQNSILYRAKKQALAPPVKKSPLIVCKDTLVIA